MDDTGKSVKDAAKKALNFLKSGGSSGGSFQGAGRKLGSSEAGRPPQRNAAAFRPPAPRKPLPTFKRDGPLPAPPPLQPQARITDELNIAVALIASSPNGAAASKTLCSVIGNVLRSPEEAKYRQLKCANARVASTLSTPGVTDLLFHLGFEHTPETSSEASTSAAAAAPFDPASPSGVIHLPVDLPGQQEPLFHGALSLLRPLVADAATGAEQPSDAAGPSAPPQPTHTLPAVAPQPQLPQPPAPPVATPAAASAPPPTQDVDMADPQHEDPAPPPPPQPPAKPVPAAPGGGGLGISREEWLAQNKNKSKRVVSVGGMAMPTKAAVKKPPEKAAAASAKEAPPAQELPEEFTGRNTKVLLPTAPGTDVPEWFFDRTGGDLKAEFQRTRAAREQRETLMTRAWREKLAKAGRKQHKFATVRVRFPEGVLLQGCFLPGAAAFEVHAWVQEHLRELAPFQLSSPALPGKAKHLGHDGTVQTAGLMPSIQLNFRWADGPVDGPTLSDAAMAMAQMDE